MLQTVAPIAGQGAHAGGRRRAEARAARGLGVDSIRMRVLADVPGVPKGTRLVWSCVFGGKKNVPAEAFLHLPQPQKFSPKILLEPTRIAVTDAAVALDDSGSGRLLLGPKSTVTQQKKLDRLGRSARVGSAAAPFSGSGVVRSRRSISRSSSRKKSCSTAGSWASRSPSEYRKDQRVFPLDRGQSQVPCRARWSRPAATARS